MTRSSRGFTLIELAIVLGIVLIIVPIVWNLYELVTDHTTLGHWQLETATAVTTIAEELRLDARAGEPTPDAVGFQRDDCLVSWRAEAGSLIREAPAACGGTRALSRRVESVGWTAGGVEVTFARALRPNRTHRITVFFPVEAP